MFRRSAVFILCCALLFAAVPIPSAVADAPYMGGGHTYYRSHTTTPAFLTDYTVNSMRHSAAGDNEEHILSFTPNPGLLPVVAGADSLYNAGVDIDEAAAYLKSLGYDVVGGINGSFFNSYMVPIGLQIKQGVLTAYNRENQPYLPSLGFTADGSVLLGSPGISLSVTSSVGTVSVDRLNNTRAPDLVYMYTRDFSDTTRTNQDGLHIVMYVPGKLAPGGLLTGTVTRVIRGSSAHTIADNEIVLSASSQNAIDRISFLAEGDPVTISASCADSRWNDAVSATTGLRYLVNDGVSSGASDNARAPRSAAGLRADGSVVLFTVDGRQHGYSTGLTLGETAQRMIDMGCVTAIELDGGGSTAMMARMPGERDAKVVNRPSDGSPRRGCDFILLCNVFPASDGSVSHLFPQPAYVTMLPNTPVTFSMLAADEYYRPAAIPAGAGGVISSSGKPGVGIASGNLFTAEYPGETSIDFVLGGAEGSAQIHVASRLDSITLTDAGTGLAVSELAAAPGQVIQLEASAMLDKSKVLSTSHSFIWSVEGDIGTITREGLFTASAELGVTGRVIVSAVGERVILPVAVGPEPIVIGSFDGGLSLLAARPGELTVRHTTDQNIVERGTGSASLSYSFAHAAPLPQSIGMSAGMSGYPTHIHLLVTGDGSGHELSVSATSVTGAVTKVSLGNLDFKGARYLSAELPPRTVSASGLTLAPGKDGPLKGTFHLHHIVAAWTETLSEQPPSVTISRSREEGDELVYTLSASDWSGNLPKEVTVRRNGVLLPSPVWDTYSGQAEVRVPLPEEGLHILSVDATDALGRRSRQISADDYGRGTSPSAIFDADGKWYTGYVDFLDSKGVIDAEDVFGLRYYSPEKPATRLEIIRMIYRVKELSPQPQVTLPFDDTGGLNQEDLDAVKAIYHAGILGGKVRPDGTLYFDADGLMTRAELFTVLNKTIPRGYERSTLSAFTDIASIPQFALRATQTLVGMGVVSGYDGMVNPGGTVLRSEVCSLFCRFYY